MQGHLLKRNLSCSVETECAVSRRTIELEMTGDSSHDIRASGEQAMLVIPLIDLGNLDAPSIVDDF